MLSRSWRRALVAVLSVCALGAAAPAGAAADDPWRDPTKPPAERADALL